MTVSVVSLYHLLRILLLALFMSPHPSISVPLRQWDVHQAVLQSYFPHGSWTPSAIPHVSEASTPSGDDDNSDVVRRPLPAPRLVGLPVSNPTKAFWTDSPGANPLAKEGSEGALIGDADVCVIGSGVTGVSAAYHLSGALAEANSNKTVVILEARDFCSGATGRNGGHLTPLVFMGFSQRQAIYGTEEAVKSYELENYTSRSLRDIVRDTDDDSDSFDEAGVDLVNGRHVTMFFTEEEEEAVRRDFEAAQKAGLGGLDEVVWIDRETMQKTRGASFPGIEIGGHNLWPLKLVARLFKLAQRRSDGVQVKLHTHTPVTAVLEGSGGGGRLWQVVTPRGGIKCDYVLHATNGYVNHLLDPERTGIQVVPTRGQIIGTRAQVGLEKVGRTSWDANEGFEYWFPRPVEKDDERPLIILGGGREASGPKFELYETNDGVVSDTVGSALKKFLPGVFPDLFERDAKVEWEWTGIMGYTKSGNPFVGPVLFDGERLKGQYVAAGYTGHGMPRGYACGEAIAGQVAAELLGRAWKQPDWLPDHYLTQRL